MGDSMKRKVIASPCEAMIGGDAFVQVMDVKITGTEDSVNLEMYVMNLYEKELTELDYEIFFFDTASIKLNEEPYDVKLSNINIKSGDIAPLETMEIPPQFAMARKAMIRLLKAVFKDGSSLSLFDEEVEKITFTDLPKSDLISMKEICGEDAYSLALEGETFYRCVCGFFNLKDSSICSNCGREKAEVLEKYSSIEKIKELIIKKSKDLDGMNEEEPFLEGENLAFTQNMNEKIFGNYKFFFIISFLLLLLSASIWFLWRF